MDRTAALTWFEQNRARSRGMFDAVRERAYYERPISLRQPFIFYEGHLSAFNFNTLLKRGLDRAAVDAPLETLFERGIDPEDEAARRDADQLWPDPQTLHRAVAAWDARVREALRNDGLEGHAAWVHTILEHEEMHHETLRYMLHRLPFEKKSLPGIASPLGEAPPKPRQIRIPRGTATIGARRGSLPFGWDNEFGQRSVEVEEFSIDAYNLTNAQYLEFVRAGGEPPVFWEKIDGRWMWRGMSRYYPLPMAWPVYVTLDQAAAFTRWKGGRVPSEAEYHRAAFGTPAGEERSFPWGEHPPDSTRGNFDFQYDDPVPVGSFPQGQSAWGVHDLVGNGWEWTSSPFEPLPGFEPMPSYPNYSTDFFDGKHFVLKGASPATSRRLVRRTFRNWFRPNYPYVYATFRCAW